MEELVDKFNCLQVKKRNAIYILVTFITFTLVQTIVVDHLHYVGIFLLILVQRNTTQHKRQHKQPPNRLK